MNKCLRKETCNNFGSFDNCIRAVFQPVGCSHYVKVRDLSTVPTPDLVRELCSRGGVVSHDISESYGVSLIHEIECLDPVDVYGPAKIIVVRGE